MQIIAILILISIVLILIFVAIHKYSPKNEQTMKTRVTQIKGDVLEAITQNIKDETRILIHVCNNLGGWGSGFVVNLSKKWKAPEQMYRELFKYKKSKHQMGVNQYILVEPQVYVVNMIAQNGYKNAENIVPLSYDALGECFKAIVLWIETENIQNPQIYCPRIGSVRGGANFEIIQIMLKEYFKDIPINVYEL